MPWFGLSNNESDESGRAEDEEIIHEKDDKIIADLEAGGSLIARSFELVPSANASSNASSSSSGSSDELAAIITDSGIQIDEDEEEEIVDQISFRSLRAGDRQRIQQLHEQWFPVTYSDEFYDELVTNQRLATSGDHLFTCVATLPKTPNDTNLFCQPAGEASIPQKLEDPEEVIGCVVGAFLHHSRLNPETAQMLVPNTQVHSRLFYIMTLGTVDEYRGLGVATMLVQQTMELVQRDPACGALYLHVIPFNHAAIRFYEKLGFYRVCTIENYYNIDDKHYDCYLYAKYFHGNRGHRTLYKIVSGAISTISSTIWQQLRVPLALFSGGSEE